MTHALRGRHPTLAGFPRAFGVIAAAAIVAIPACAPRDPPADPASPLQGMVWVPGGEFTMGSVNGVLAPDAGPAHQVWISAFWLDRTEVTNRQFRAFADATSYLTLAERSLHGPNWTAPEGPGSDIDARMDHPVVYVTWEDAAAYCAWNGKRLPTEAEWEFAARGGVEGGDLVWLDDPYQVRPAVHAVATVPLGEGDAADAWVRTAPAGSSAPNAYGLKGLAGNVREWVSDWYHSGYYDLLAAAQGVTVDPQGPGRSFDPDEPSMQKRVLRGGSWRCSDGRCAPSGPASRDKAGPHERADHVGFRCAA